MRTVGQILKEERERKLLTLDEIEKNTKIRKELLQALEADNFAKLPPPTFVQGFIKNYGKFLGLDIEKLLAIYRREYADHKNPPRVMEALANPMQETKFRITPAKLLSLVIVVLVLSFFAYLWIEFRFLVGAPYLEVDKPSDQQTINVTNINISGRTDAEAKVEINNQEVSVDQNGNFSQELKLTDAATKISVTATSKSGKTAKIERTVYLKQ